MSSGNPKLRTDLRIQEADQGRLVKIAHRGMVGSATFSKGQYHLLTLIDGQRTPAQIARDARRLLDQRINTFDVEALLETLGSLGLLEEENQPPHRPGGLSPTLESTEWFVEDLKGEDDDGPTTLSLEDKLQQVPSQPLPLPGRTPQAPPPRTPAPPTRRKDVAELVNAARALRNNELPDDARQYVQQALALDPADAEAQALERELSGQGEPTAVTSREEPGADVIEVAGADAVEEASESSEPTKTGAEPAAAPSEEEAPVDAAEEAERDEAIIEANIRKRRRRWLRFLIFLLILGAIGVGLHFVPYELTINEQCILEPTKRVMIRARVKGLLKTVYVQESSLVQKGALVAQLDDLEYAAEVKKVHAKLQVAQAELKKLRLGARKEEVAQARQVVATKATEVSYAQRDYQRQAKLSRQNLVSREKLDAASRELAVRQRELAEANAALRLLMAGSRKEVVEAKDAEIRQLMAELDYKKLQLDFTKVSSPITGRVVTPRMEEKANTYVDSGTPICEVVDTLTMRAEVLVPERELDAIRVGQRVEVKVRSYPERSFFGKVIFIAPKVDKGAITNTLRVLSLLENPEHLLKPEMTGQAKIRCGKRSVLSLIMRRFLRWVRVEFVL
jgi:HlyD family secretion protein